MYVHITEIIFITNKETTQAFKMVRCDRRGEVLSVLYDPQIINFLSVVVTLCTLWLLTFTIDVGKIACVGRCCNKKR